MKVQHDGQINGAQLAEEILEATGIDFQSAFRGATPFIREKPDRLRIEPSAYQHLGLDNDTLRTIRSVMRNHVGEDREPPPTIEDRISILEDLVREQAARIATLEGKGELDGDKPTD